MQTATSWYWPVGQNEQPDEFRFAAKLARRTLFTRHTFICCKTWADYRYLWGNYDKMQPFCVEKYHMDTLCNFHSCYAWYNSQVRKDGR